MICRSCRAAGEMFQLGTVPDNVIKTGHMQCPGVTFNKTWCDCAHQIGIRVNPNASLH